MAELTVGQLIKLILGVLVFVAVVIGVYFVFDNYVVDFLNNVVSDGGNKFSLTLLI